MALRARPADLAPIFLEITSDMCSSDQSGLSGPIAIHDAQSDTVICQRIEEKNGNTDASFGEIVTCRYPHASAGRYFNNASLFGHALHALSFDHLIFGGSGLLNRISQMWIIVAPEELPRHLPRNGHKSDVAMYRGINAFCSV